MMYEPIILDQNNNCYTKLKIDIINGIYVPGEKLSMPKLKTALDLGQSPIREALSRLLAEGLIQTEKNKGFYVSRISEIELRDLFKTIGWVENIAIRQSIELGDDKWEINLVANFHKLSLIETKKESIDYCYFVESSYAFHKALILGCNSPSLIYIHDFLFIKVKRYLKLAIKFDSKIADICYERKKTLFNAALNRNPDEACRIFSTTLNESVDHVIKPLKMNNLL